MADFPITLNKTYCVPLLEPERAAGFTHKFTIPYSTVAVSTATGTTDTVTVTLCSTPAFFAVKSGLGIVRTAFTGTTALTVTVGTAGSAAAILPSTTVLSGSVIQPTTGFGNVVTPGSTFAASATTLRAVFTNATGGSPSALTAGSLDIYVALLDLSKIG